MKKMRLVKLSIIAVVVVFLGLSCTNDTQEEPTEITAGDSGNTTSYYYSGGKHMLQKTSDKEFVLLKGTPKEALSYKGFDFLTDPVDAIVSSIIPVKTAMMPSKRSWAIVKKSDALSNNDKVLYRGPVFLTEAKDELALSHLFYVKLKRSADENKLRLIERKYRVKLLGHNIFMKLWFTFECSKKSLGNSLEISREIYETGEFAESYPDLINLQGDVLSVNDLKSSQQ